MDLEEFLAEWHNDSPTVLVHTSGSTGKPKPMLVEKRRMEASARITCGFLGLKSGDSALLCMSLDYIAGKMMVVRALSFGLRLIVVKPSGNPLGTVAEPVDFAAMVPMQVYNSLQVPEECKKLMAIKHLIIGGGAIDDALASELKTFPNAVWSTYGMTETLSHIALRRLNGPEASEWYTPFEGVGISLNDEGCLVVDAPAVCAEPLVTNDIAELRPETTDEDCQTASSGIASGQPANGAVGRRIQFRILGRRDNVICSGGVKIQIEQVEQVLRAHTDVPLLITKTADRLLGEQVVMLTESSDLSSLQSLCRRVLPRYWQPRRILTVDSLPLTPTGKPARSEAMRIAEANCTLHNT
jgi:O-succinylbenzoic acid--CoA ligase